ncbi:MAG TPA: hypothetical protein VKA67_03120, partial [Verrucomicrobiae bacterium]|nr:hypothetical protein [Verrucomicrobiae bacterium]
ATVSDYALTGTVQYDLWANVISRLELRYDYNDGFNGQSADPYGQTYQKNAVTFYANVIYKF